MIGSHLPDRARTDFIVVHCSATPPDLDVGVKEIDQWHRDRDFDCIGYGAVVRRSGLIELGRPLQAVGAHVRGFNSRSLGVCLVGGVNEENVNTAEANYTPAQYNSLARLLSALELVWPGAAVVGHRDLSPDADGNGEITPDEWLKDCPCFDVGAWWALRKPKGPYDDAIYHSSR